jgi:hypothetical protein
MSLRHIQPGKIHSSFKVNNPCVAACRQKKDSDYKTFLAGRQKAESEVIIFFAQQH